MKKKQIQKKLTLNKEIISDLSKSKILGGVKAGDSDNDCYTGVCPSEPSRCVACKPPLQNV